MANVKRGEVGEHKKEERREKLLGLPRFLKEKEKAKGGKLHFLEERVKGLEGANGERHPPKVGSFWYAHEGGAR